VLGRKLADEPRRRIADPVLAFVRLVLLSQSIWRRALDPRQSGRPVFFVQPQAGKDGRPFSMFKYQRWCAVEIGRRWS
jgi:lipopolysaccharide/colanic/teichoic acid biosynthesis glycosyltransferase